jgi:hypothetical protein
MIPSWPTIQTLSRCPHGADGRLCRSGRGRRVVEVEVEEPALSPVEGMTFRTHSYDRRLFIPYFTPRSVNQS